jgi:hypothetical protein
VVPQSVHDFFVASASVAGALVGLLFVAISVAAGRLAREDAQLHRVRAVAALTAFTNALAVSLFALVPVHKIGPASLVMAILGLVFVLAALLSLVRLGQLRLGTVHDVLFLAGLVVTFVAQLTQAADVIAHPGDGGAVDTIAVLVIICFLIGTARSWELIGGPSIGITTEVLEVFRRARPTADEPADGDPADGEQPESRPAP